MEKITVSHVGTDHISFYSGSDYIWYPINFDTPRQDILTYLKENGYKVSLLGLDSVVCSDPSVHHITRVRTPDHNPVLIAFHDDGKAGIIERPELHQRHHDTVQGILFDLAQEALAVKQQEEDDRRREEERLREQERIFQRERERVEEIRRLQELAEQEKEEKERLEAERKIQELKDQEAKEELERQEKIRREQEEAEQQKKEKEEAAEKARLELEEAERIAREQEEAERLAQEEEDIQESEEDSEEEPEDETPEEEGSEEEEPDTEEVEEIEENPDEEITEEAEEVEGATEIVEVVEEETIEVPVARIRAEPEQPEFDEEGIPWLAAPEDEAILARLEEDDLVFERDGWSDPDWDEEELESLDWDDIDEDPVADVKDEKPVIPEEKPEIKEYEYSRFEEPEQPSDPVESAVEKVLAHSDGNIGREDAAKDDSFAPLDHEVKTEDNAAKWEFDHQVVPAEDYAAPEKALPPEREVVSGTGWEESSVAYETSQMSSEAAYQSTPAAGSQVETQHQESLPPVPPADPKPWEQFEEQASGWGGSATSKRRDDISESMEVHQPIAADLTTEEAAIRNDELERSKKDKASQDLRSRFTHDEPEKKDQELSGPPEVAEQLLESEDETESTFTSGWKLFDHHVQRAKPLKIKIQSKTIAGKYQGFRLRKFNRSYLPIFFDELNSQGITHKKLMDQDKTEINQWVELKFQNNQSVHIMITYAPRGKANKNEEFFVYFPKKIADKKTYHQGFLNALVIYKIWNHVLYKINWYTADHNFKPANREALVKYFLNLDKMQDLG